MIIAIAGKNGVGKDTAGKILIGFLKEEIGELFFVKKFAEAPNNIFKSISKIDFLSLPRESKELTRSTFVKFCEGVKDVFGKKVWSQKLLSEYNEEDDNWIITDLRFEEEKEELLKLNTQFLYIAFEKEDISDIAKENRYYIIRRGFTEEDLKSKLKEYVDYLIEREKI